MVFAGNSREVMTGNHFTHRPYLGRSVLTYDHPNGFTYLQLGRDFINLFLFKYMAF